MVGRFNPDFDLRIIPANTFDVVNHKKTHPYYDQEGKFFIQEFDGP